MSLGHGASIVRNGLVLHLDAANVKSYNSATSTSTWFDLSGNNNHATLVSGPTFSNSSFLLQYSTATNEANNDFISAPASLNTINVPLTMECWFRMKTEGYDTAQKFLALMGSSGTSSTGSGIMLGVSSVRQALVIVYNGSGQQVLNSPSSPIIQLDTWYMMAVTLDGTSCKLYLNGNRISDVAVSGFTPFGTSSSFNIGLNRIYYHFGGNISNCKHYTTALTDAEIQQNFNALRGRYGI